MLGPVIDARLTRFFFVEMPNIVLFYVSLPYLNGMIIIRRRITQTLVLAESC